MKTTMEEPPELPRGDGAPRPPLHVLHVVPTLGAGGLELALSRLVAGLQQRGMRHSIVCLKGEAVIADRFDDRVAIHCVHAGRNELLLPRRLRRILRAARPDVIHARNWSAWPDVALARLGLGRGRRLPLVFSFHGTDRAMAIPWRRRVAFRSLARITERMFTVSTASRDLLARQVGLDPRSVGIIPNGVDTERFAPLAGGFRKRGVRLIVGSVGNLTPVKAQGLLVGAAAVLAGRGLDIEVRIAGEGPEESRLREMATELGIGDRLNLPGRIEDIPAFLRDLDVFVLCSDSEAHPNALIEAMACGLPVVATRVGGIGEVLREGAVGRLIDRGDGEALAAAIEEIARDPELARDLGKRSRERAVSGYGMDRMTGEYAALYESAAGRRAPVARPTERRPRVLMVGPVPPPLGGMASVLDNLRRSSLSTRTSLEVFDDAKPTREGRSLAEAVLGQGRLFLEYLAALWQRRPCIIHLHTCSGLIFWRDAALALIARASGRSLVWHVHGGLFEEFIRRQGVLRRPLLGAALRLGARVLVLSASWRERLAPLVPGVTWEVVPNGVPLPAEPVDPGTPGRCIFLFMGHLGPEKGCDDLVDAVAAARARSFGGRLDLAGKELEPGQRRKLEARVVERGCTDLIRLVGVISGEAKLQALAETRCLVLPSHAEALPMAVLEGMAWGFPIIATRVGAIPEVVGDGEEGLLIEPGDVPALTECLLRIDGDPELRRRLGAAGRARVTASFSLEAMAERVAGIYAEILAAPRRMWTK